KRAKLQENFAMSLATADAATQKDFISSQRSKKDNQLVSDVIAAERRRNAADAKKGVKDHRFSGGDLDDLDKQNQEKAKKERFYSVYAGVRQRMYHTQIAGDVTCSEELRYDAQGTAHRFAIATTSGGEKTQIVTDPRDVLAYTKGPGGELIPM